MRRVCVISLSLAIIFCTGVSAQLAEAHKKAILVKRMIELNHYSPRAVDDSFSVHLFRSMVNATDAKRLLFTAPEYQSLSAFAYKLDDELNGNGWAFLNAFSLVYKRSLARADSIIFTVLQKPFDFTVNESVAVSKERTYNFAANSNELIMRWIKYLKLEALEQLYDIISADSTGNGLSKEKVTRTEPGVRAKLKESEKKNIQRALEQNGGIENTILELYLNEIATSFDPHTNYFSPEGKEAFQSALSTEELSYGLEFDEEDNGRIVISHLLPGGPAWKTGELHKGDELLQLHAENKEPVSVSGLSLEEVYDILDQPGKEQLVLKIRKAGGVQKIVTLRKEKVSNEENIVRSFVLQGDKKIGYILLPGFYTEWENEKGSGCANDVAKEIIKLKREKIEGLIIDVRYNGGGSMNEGLEMTGIFVEEGPLAGQKNAKGKVTYYKDPNRGVIYDGPLALMVNGQSASASEMLAASLQDYHRAVVIGSPTYGKASVQQLFPLDSTFGPDRELPADIKDMVKITMGKFYRLDGSSSQLKGVQPDIVLPDVFGGAEVGERFSDNALTSDSITKNGYYKPLALLPVGELARRSAERISGNADFVNIQKLISVQSRTRNEPMMIIPLKWDSFEKWANQQVTDIEITEGGTMEGNKKFEVKNNQLDLLWTQKDEYEKEINLEWLENITRDIYIQEAFLIVCDLINLQRPSSKN
ncbi:MAG: carboxy terminal-processing peptidase [Chitinophagaceae bacterium]|nr:carboxy terminal-processing peptidase [Chitinophagaceae bacterium]